MPIAERRHFGRVPATLPLVQHEEKNFPFAAILDFSAGGVRFRCNPQSDISEGGAYPVTFSLHPSTPLIRATVKIKWTNRIGESLVAGGQFTQINQESKSILNYLAVKARYPQINLSEPFLFYFMNLLRKNAIRSTIADVWSLALPEKLLRNTQPFKNLTKRDDIFFQCCYYALQETSLACVPLSLKEQLVQTKFKGFLFSIILDDLLDEQKQFNLVASAIEIPFGHEKKSDKSLRPSEEHILGSLRTLWRQFDAELHQAPQFEKFKELFRHDYEQILSCVKYTSLLHRYPHFNNPYEAQMWLPHTTHILLNTTLDLMFTPNFNNQDLGSLRHFAQIAQYISHIANWISSWKKEFLNGDFTSGIFAYLLQEKLISTEELLDENKQKITQAKIESSDFKEYCYFLLDVTRQELEKQKNKVISLDLSHYLKGIEDLLLMQTSYNF